jgi:hypothetical protein
MVEIEGERVLAASCLRQPAPGMKVKTDTQRAKTARKMVAELLVEGQIIVYQFLQWEHYQLRLLVFGRLQLLAIQLFLLDLIIHYQFSQEQFGHLLVGQLTQIKDCLVVVMLADNQFLVVGQTIHFLDNLLGQTIHFHLENSG